MKIVFQIADIDNSVIGLTEDPNVAEKIVVDAFNAVRLGEEELVKIIYEGSPLYTSRRKAEVVEEEFEYVDNDGNPINADGSDKLDSDVVIEAPMYEYEGEYAFMVKDIEKDELVNLSTSDIFLPELCLLFEGHESFVVIPTH